MKREQGKLEVLGQSAKQPHFADVLQGLISECDSFRVDAADLKKGAEQVESMVLQRKLQELAHIMERTKKHWPPPVLIRLIVWKSSWRYYQKAR